MFICMIVLRIKYWREELYLDFIEFLVNIIEENFGII